LVELDQDPHELAANRLRAEDLGQLGELEQPVRVPRRPVRIVTVDDAIDEMVGLAGLVKQVGDAGVAVVVHGPQRYSGFTKSKRQPASHSERWLPCAGIPPASRNMRARCKRFQVRKVVLRLVKSLSGPPEPGSR